MSERSEMEHAVGRVGAGTIPLSILIEFISQKVYTDLMRLIDLLPSKTDLEKKIEIATFFSRTQHLFIRLEALVKWSNSASKVDKCEKISNFLEEQSFFLISTANALSRLLRETLVSARLPPFSVLLAIDIFTNKGYTRLPKSIKNSAFVAEYVTEQEKKQALIDLNCIIQNRLSLTQLPHQFRTIKIADGRAQFVVQNEFSVTVTLMSEALDFPWRILDLKFLLKDPSMNYQNLVHPAQTRLIINQAQSRLLYRQFDKRPPLVHLYDMLHAFSLSLQLDMLHEQAQRARSKRPPDQLTIEAYRPSRCLSISYWHGLARTQYNSVMALDGKLHPTAYLLTIHVDATEPQRPLCVSHRPELTTSKSQLVGATVQGDCLSIETLLTRTMVARAEQMLQDLRQELLILSPGPVRLADAPLCLYVPLLWPCGSHELLQVRIDPVQGFVCTSFPLLTSLDTEFGSTGSAVVNVSFGPTGISENFSRSSVINTLASLESAFNQASCHRVRLVSATGTLVQPHESDRICSIQSRSLRNLSHGDARWRSVICECLEHLRLCLGLARLMQTAKIHRPFWQPFKRHLPLILSPAQVELSNSWSENLVRLQQSYRWPILFAQLFPNNEYYIACEVISTPLNVDYKYYLIVCSALPEHTNVTTNLQGVLVFNSEINPASGHVNETGLFLQVTHFTSLIADTVWSNNPSTTLEQLCACIKKAQSTIVNQRSTRLNELLNKIKLSNALDNKSFYNDDVVTHKSVSLLEPQTTVPTLARLIGTLEENILTNYLMVELSCAGIEHNGMRYDGAGCLSAITITSIPFNPPSWYSSDIIPLMDFVHEMILRPHFDPFTHRRSWQLDIVFTGIVAPLNGIHQVSSTYLRHQTAEWTVSRLEHFNIVVQNILVEWENLCSMHALCYHVITNPDTYLPKGVQVYSYNLRSISLVYGTYYLADISNPTGLKFILALGFRPISLSSSSSSSSTTKPLNSDDITTNTVINVDFNPHMIIRQHLEELLNARKSICTLATTLLNTLEFFQCMEPLRDQILSYNGLKVTSLYNNYIQPVCGMLLIALSPYDLILIYRASLSLRITLDIVQQSVLSSTIISSSSLSSDHNPNNTPKTIKSIQLIDAYNQLATGQKLFPPIVNTDGWNSSQLTNDKALCNLAPLPAFSKFLRSLQELFRINSDEKLVKLTLSQFAQLTRSTFSEFESGVISSKASSVTNCCRRTNLGLTLLESYLSTSLLFHAAILAAQSLDVPIHHVHNEIYEQPQQQQTDEQQRIKNQQDLLENAKFVCIWPVSQTTVQLSMLCQPTACDGIEPFWWRLKLQLNQSVNSCDRWPPETLNVFEEFFEKRVCSFPFQPSAVTAFFRLLLLPPHALRAMGRVLAFDLHSPAQAPVYVRIGLIGMGVNSRVTAINSSNNNSLTNQPANTAASGAAQNLLTFDTGSDLQPGMPGIIVRPSKITLQLLIMRSHSRHLPKSLIPLAQLVVVGYDWDANYVVIYPTASHQSSQNVTPNSRNQSDTTGLNLLRLLHDTDVESKANAMAASSNDSALVQIVLLITQTVAASYPISSAGSASMNSSLSGFVYLSNGQKSCPAVNYITPTEASTEGGSAIMIFGCGFEQSAFVLPGSNSNSGNRVFLRNAWQTYTTELIEEGGNMIKFSSPKVPEDSYKIMVSVSGIMIPSERMCLGYECTLTIKSSVTPTIEKVSPIYAPPGSIIGLNGTIFTSRFSSNLDVFTVGRPQSIIRIYDGPGNCEPQLPNSDLYYGIGLLSPTSDKGYIMCKRSVLQTGSVNISFLVDAPYGRSKTLESVYRVDRNEQTFMHQSYSVINEVTSIQTSSSGGGSIEITGEYLNPQNDVTISVGFTKCSPTLMNSTYIHCILDHIEQTPKPEVYPGNRGLTVQFWSNLKASNVNDLLKLNFDEISNTTAEETYLYEPEFIPKDLFNGTGIIRLSMIFVPLKNSYYQFLISSVNIYTLLGGKLNETLTQMNVINSRTAPIYLKKNEDFQLELRSTVSQPTAVIRICASLSNTSLNYQQLKASKPTSYLISIKSKDNTEKQVIDHSGLVNSSITPIAEIQTISIPVTATQYKLCLFDSCTVPLPVQNPNVDLINSEMSEKFNGSSVKTKIIQTTNDYLVLEITFPQEYGDLPLLKAYSFPETINKPQVNETVQGMTGFSNTIRPSYGGMYSYMTYTLASTESEIRLAYLNLGSSWCPSKLINPTFKFAVLDDFETSTLSTVTTETIAFCGRQSVLNLFTYTFSQLIAVNTNPHLCFAIKGKTKDSISLLYNAIGVTSRLLKQTLTYSIDLTGKDENSWKFKCINVLQLLRADPRNVNATIFQLESFTIPPRKKFYELEYSLSLDTVFMGTKPISDNPDDVVTWPRFPKDIFSDIKITKNSSTVGVLTVEIITKSCRSNFDLFGLAGVNMPNDNKTLDQTVNLRDNRWPTVIQSSVTRIQSASPPIDGNFILSFKGAPTSRIPAKFIEPSVIERQLNLHPLMGAVRVCRFGWCRSFQYNFWLDSLPGDQPEISVMNETRLIGDSPQITVQKNAIGELIMCPISGDMVATKHSLPQVRLYVDNLPAYCESSCDHQFVDILTPVVTNSTVQISTTQIIINGLRFTPTMMIFIGGVRVENFTFINSTQIIILAPAQKVNGEKSISLFGATNVLIDSGFSVTYKFEIADIKPQIGSFVGGQVVNIVGDGFDNDVKVFMKPVTVANQLCNDRPRAECEILSKSSKMIQCKTTPMVKTHYVLDSGTDPVRGLGYEWQPKALTIIQGDSVVWIWNTTTRINPLMIAEIYGPEDITLSEFGFHSGQPTKNGVYRFNFTQPGTYYYTSSTTFLMMGIIEVKAFDDCITEIIVETDYSTAVHSDVPATLYWDSLTTCEGGINCDILTKPSELLTKHGFVYRGCATPIVSSFSPFNVYADSVISINSPILANCMNQLNINIAGAYCTLTNQDNIPDSGTVECNLTEEQVVSAGLLTGQPLRPCISHVDLGYALLEVSTNEFEQYAFFWPSVNCNKTYGRGSIYGGGQLTVYGSGFDSIYKDYNKITFNNGKICNIIEVTSGFVRCLVPPPESTTIESSLNMTIQVQTKSRNQNDWIDSQHNMMHHENCIYSYDITATPIVKSIEPREINASNQTLLINGNNLLFSNENSSNLQIQLDGIPCIVDDKLTAMNTLSCRIDGSLPAGYVTLTLFHELRGTAKYETNTTLKSQMSFTTIEPLEGSFAGGTIVKLTGNGLNDPTLKIFFNSKECEIISETRTIDQIYCRTPEQRNYSNLETYKVPINLSNTPSILNEFTYVSTKTPKVTNFTLSPIYAEETFLTQLRIYGTMLDGGDITQTQLTEIKLNQTLCIAEIIQSDYIQCCVKNLPSGMYQLIVDTPIYGYALANDNVNINFTLDSITPNTGGTEGGQLVVIEGSGMNVEKTIITICDQICSTVGGSSLALKCITPKLFTTNTKLCNVTVVVPTTGNILQKTLIDAFTYDANLSPRIISVAPLIGGTGGGTDLTIIGTLFDDSTTVSVGGIDCQLISLNDTVIICRTGEHNGTAKVPIVVTVKNNGKASGNFLFYYVDRWSSPFTWNNQPIPVENDFVVINANQSIMLDMDTPILSMLLINGGTLFFDPTKNIQLNSKYILILNNGKFLIGSPEEPYTKQATIRLHGHVREKELPLYGAKVLALRNGTISIHGKPRVVTWTRLTKTAEAGTNTLTLEHPVDWQPGEHIIITSTGGKSSHNESEEHVIQEISSDNRTITLVGQLAYKKLSVKKTYSNGVTGNFAAEVGLLSRNILIRGTEEPVVSSSVPKCPSSFSTNQFATHTCIIGSPNEQLGANEYGGHVHIGGPFVDSGAVKVYISYTEFYFMGQAYRLGRYPIHFHLNGLMNGSYVRGCSIHKGFNRAINVHNTHEVLIENNVVYDIMGGAFFLEDGIEHGNLIQYNLFVHVKRTSSLLNDDVVPAAFWITQPNNTIQHNVAASGTHFGFWYRMLENPSGPSTTTTVCPRKIPLGIFENNTVHSQGWFALWIHESFFPTKTGTCGTTKWDKAVFRKLTAWNNNKGPECVNCGSVQFEDMLLVNNDEAAIEGKRLMNGNLYDPTIGPLYKNSTIIAYEPDLVNGNPECHTRAVILPWAPGLTVENMVMRNFNGQNCTAIHGTVITCLCSLHCGGYEYLFKDIKWEDTNNRAEFRWHGDFSLRDVDGSLTDGIPNVPKLPGSLVVGKANHLPADKCGPSAPGAGDLGSAFGQGAVPGVRCLPDVTALRYAVDQTNPGILMGSNMTVTLLDGGTEEVPFKTQALTDKQGWMTTLVNNRTYIVSWEAKSSFTNLSYIGYLENFRQSDYVIIRHMGMDIKPDRVQVLSGQTPKPPISESLNPLIHNNGEVFYNETGKYIEYLVKAPVNPSSFNSYRLWVWFYKCFFTDCIVPSSSSVSVLDSSRPADALYWSKNNTWTDVLGPQPVNGSSLVIPKGKWLVLDKSINIRLSNITIYGTFEVDSGTSQDQRVYKLAFKQMLIVGGQFLAGPLLEKPLTNATLELTLLGSISDEFINLDGPVIGPKSIGVYGAMSMHAVPKTIRWTTLKLKANAGDNQLYLTDPVTDWLPGDRIVIATTSMNYKQSEVGEIASVSSDRTVITLVDKLTYTHVAYNQTYGNHKFILGAEVGLIKSNIIIKGDDQSVKTNFGGRILVSQTLYDSGILYGQLKLSGVHFYQMGQKDFSTVTDARFPVAFISAGDMNNVSYIKSCIFEYSLSTALGGFATTGLLVENNIFYQTFGSAIWLTDGNHKLLHNLLMETIWSGQSTADNENLGILFEAALDIKEASDLILQENSIAGAERLCVYTQGNPCDGSSTAIWEKNIIHSCLIGIMQLNTQYTCTIISNAQIYSVSQFPVYWRTASAIQANNLQLVDNAGGIILCNVRFDKCNDMECDGLKKVLVIDKDGGLFGQPSVIVPQSEWQYNLNPKYGVSDSRIPSRMLTKADGTSINPAIQWPNKGIIRDSSCIYTPKMQAYKCSNALDHKILLIESMDPDALERRLSPIAFATDGLSSNYIDLINGPSDHGVCSSYACLKRMSTFMAVVARQKNFVLYMTSTPPQELRLRLPQAEPDYAVRLGIDYFTAGRLDIYVNGVYVKAKNAVTNNLGQTVLQEPKTLDEFMPNVLTDPVGTNYFDDSSQMLYVIIKGEDIITVKLSQLVKVSFGLPAMTIDQFYGSEVVNNLANYLGIPAKNIRIVKVVSESSAASGRRRRRSVSGVFVELEISTPPSQNLSSADTPNVTSGMTKVEEISSNVVTLVQTGLLETVINATVVNVAVQKPTPLPGTELWAAQATDPTNVQANPEVIQIPVKSQVKILVPTGYTSVVEGVPFMAEISTLDSSGNIVKPLGSNSSIWSYEILQPNAVSPVKVSKTNFPDPATGKALVSNLIFSEPGQADLFVSVTSPNESTRLNTSVSFPVTSRQLRLRIRPVTSNSDDSPIKSSVNQSISLLMNIIDKQTGVPLEKINWRNLIWKFTGDICTNSRKPKTTPTNSSASLVYDSTKTSNNFTWTINGFQTSWVYTYCISANAYSNDSTTKQSQYDLPLTKIRIQVNPENYTEPVRNVRKPFRFKVTGNYATMLQHVDEFKAALESELLTRYPNVVFENITFSQGSITVDLVAASDTLTTIQNALTNFASTLNDGSVTFSVGGVDYTASSENKNAGCRPTGFLTPLITGLFSLLTYQLLLKIYLF
ncbi:unnamed protein product [Schistosoma turkestanicum]|nr:unnamed protein product [Schistosoma turkestanicum]